MPIISIIAAIGNNRELGKNNQLLWNIPEDMRRFRELTTGHVVVMGQKTYESIGRPLPHRTNIILTVDMEFVAPGCIVVHSLEEALAQAQSLEKHEIFIIGGGSVYAQTLPMVDRLYITLVDASFDADVYFPEYKEHFSRVVSQEIRKSDDVSLTFFVLERASD